MVAVISDGNRRQNLHYLLEFLAAWEKRPASLAAMAYEWCSAISEAAGRLGQEGNPITQSRLSHNELRLRPRLGDHGRAEFFPFPIEEGLPGAGSDHDPTRPVSDQARGDLQDPWLGLLSATLKIGFRLVVPDCDQPTLSLNRTPRHDWVFETAFSSGDDETIADALCAWIASGHCPLPGSCMEDLIKRMGGNTPLSTRLWRMTVYAIERIWRGELDAPAVDAVRLLDKLMLREKLDVDFWGELEGQMEGVWQSVLQPEAMEGVGRVTLKLLLQRPSALPRFEGISKTLQMEKMVELRRICELARTEQPPPESPPP